MPPVHLGEQRIHAIVHFPASDARSPPRLICSAPPSPGSNEHCATTAVSSCLVRPYPHDLPRRLAPISAMAELLSPPYLSSPWPLCLLVVAEHVSVLATLLGTQRANQFGLFRVKTPWPLRHRAPPPLDSTVRPAPTSPRPPACPRRSTRARGTRRYHPRVLPWPESARRPTPAARVISGDRRANSGDVAVINPLIRR